MQTYLVGGAVRDALLEIPVTERDWVIVGATPEAMLERGYKQVGKDFPVFLHPETHEEYALARVERKIGRGYTGFACDSSPDVTLEQDLLRRDLTINAIAQDTDGNLIDPYNGEQDLANKQLRHVSPAFSEDPLRVLRVARFAARFAHLGFVVATETQDLLRTMVNSGELNDLVAERVWQECAKGLATPMPQRFITALRGCDALRIIFPEVDRLFGVPQPPKYHPEIDTGEHVLLALQQAAELQTSTAVRFAVLLHDLGKGITPAEDLPNHHGHEKLGCPLVEEVCSRLRAPKEYRSLALKVCEWHLHSHRALQLKPATVLKLFEALDVWRRPHLFTEFLLASEADARGRTGLENQPYRQAEYLRAALDACAIVNIQSLVDEGLSGSKLGQQLRAQRVVALTAFKDNNMGAYV
ncbi:MAG: multifunctional CCA addition/repair protein [Pseudomonadales bacterium]